MSFVSVFQKELFAHKLKTILNPYQLSIGRETDCTSLYLSEYANSLTNIVCADNP